MLYANHPESGAKILAEPQAWATCPGCGARVIAKCGEINVWHWAHEADSDCDPWSEGESAWHAGWKQQVHSGRCEVVMRQHRADIVGHKGVVIELQHSSLSPSEVREREEFYKNLIWIIDASEFADNFSFLRKGEVETFRWKWPRRWLFHVSQPACLDFGEGDLFLIRRLYCKTPCGGYGSWLSADRFIRRWINRGS